MVTFVCFKFVIEPVTVQSLRHLPVSRELQCAVGLILLFPLNLIQIQGLLRNCGGRGNVAVHSFDVFAVALVGWPGRSLRCQTSSSEQYAGTASGINNTVDRVAAVLSIAVLGIVMIAGFG